MEYDPSLYDIAINQVAIGLQDDYPLLSPSTCWESATTAVRRLVEEDLIIKPSLCGWRNPEHTADCENLVPLGRSLCYRHSNY